MLAAVVVALIKVEPVALVAQEAVAMVEL